MTPLKRGNVTTFDIFKSTPFIKKKVTGLGLFHPLGSKFQVLIANAKERTPPAETPTPERTGSPGQKPVMERTLQQSECKVFYWYGQIKERPAIA